MSKGLEKYLDSFKYYLSIERSFSINTVESYIYDCERLISFINDKYPNIAIKDIKTSILEEFIISLEKKKSKNEEDFLLSATTQIRIIQGIRALFKFLLISEKIEKNPAEHITTPYLEKKLPDILDREEIKQMMRVVDVSTKHGFRNRLIIAMLYATGMRVSELVNLKLSDINYKEEYLDIIGKGNKERFIPIDKKVLNDLKVYINKYRVLQKVKEEDKNYVFLSEKRGERLTRQFIFKMLREVASQAGIKKTVHPHIFRHSFATEMIRAGANLVAVKEILGHTSIASTEIYINLKTSDLRKTLQEYHPFFQK